MGNNIGVEGLSQQSRHAREICSEFFFRNRRDMMAGCRENGISVELGSEQSVAGLMFNRKG